MTHNGPGVAGAHTSPAHACAAHAPNAPGRAAPGMRAAGLVPAALSLDIFVAAYLVLPESLKAEHRTERPLWDLSHIGDAIRHPRLGPLMIAWALAPFAFSGYTA